MFKQAWRMTWRDWRAGELRFLLIALIVAVAASSCVGFFVERMRSALIQDANQLIGADLVIAANHALPPNWENKAHDLGLQLAKTIVFPSMAQSGEGELQRALLTSIKAVTADYPLRGQLTLSTQDGARVSAEGGPQSGTVWVDRAVLVGLSAQVGDQIQLGKSRFTIAAVIDAEPDRGAGFVNFAPRVMLAYDALPATGLIAFGSRASYRLLLAGDHAAVKAFQQWGLAEMGTEQPSGIRIESLEEGRPEMRATLARAEQFLLLVSMLSTMLAAIAVAMAARQFMLRHINSSAVLRCLGLTQAALLRLFCYEFVWVGLLGGIIGVLFGYAAHFVLIASLSNYLPTELPTASLWPSVKGVALALLLLVGFALPPLLQLRQIAPVTVLRGQSGHPKAGSVLTYVMGTFMFVLLVLGQTREWQLGLIAVFGLLLGLAVFTVSAWCALRLLRHVKRWSSSLSWRFAITGLQRRPVSTITQIVALSLGMMVLILLVLVRADLIHAWRQAVPVDAPNRFVINIQEDQLAGVEARLQAFDVPTPHFYPMIRGRLVRINDVDVDPANFNDKRAQNMLNREFNLSTSSSLPAGNQIVAGRWFDDAVPEASFEAGLAKTLRLKIGDVVQFDIAGQRQDVTITSLRDVEWGTLQANFFVLLNPASVQTMPQTWMTAFHLPGDGLAFDYALSQEFSNLTVVDVSRILQQMQAIMSQVLIAVEFLFLFSLLSGMLVLYAALLGSQRDRIVETAILRVLGATRNSIARAQWIECAITGALAGTFAATGAAAIAWALAHYVFKFSWSLSIWLWVISALIGVLCALLGAYLSLRPVLQSPPLASLREV
jgi:putative ABC transport system permease protein